MSEGFAPFFSHIYVERGAGDYPLTRLVLEKFPRAAVIPVGHYKDVFSRAGQDFYAQKRSPKLILAVRREKWLFPGSALCDDYGHERFYYATQMFNCPYDCAYCYLRGLYGSANLVAFVNTDDYFDAALEILRPMQSELSGHGASCSSAQPGLIGHVASHAPMQPAFLSVSYDADLLVVERIFHYAESWIAFAAAHPSLTLEIRTKSASFAAIGRLPSVPNVILSWTLSPDEIIERYEKNTPSLSARLASMRAAIEAGWRVRLCADPILLLPGWESRLVTLFERTKASLETEKVYDISAGGFRISKTFYRRMLRLPDADLLRALPLTEAGGIMRYSDADEARIQALVCALTARCNFCEKSR